MTFIRVTVSKIIAVDEFTAEELQGSTLEAWYESHFAGGDASLDRGEYEAINYDSVTVERVNDNPSDCVLLKVKYDDVLVSPQFLAEHLQELEGVESVEID